MKGSARWYGGEVGCGGCGGRWGIGDVFVWQMLNGYNREKGKIGRTQEDGKGWWEGGEEWRVKVWGMTGGWSQGGDVCIWPAAEHVCTRSSLGFCWRGRKFNMFSSVIFYCYFSMWVAILCRIIRQYLQDFDYFPMIFFFVFLSTALVCPMKMNIQYCINMANFDSLMRRGGRKKLGISAC